MKRTYDRAAVEARNPYTWTADELAFVLYADGFRPNGNNADRASRAQRAAARSKALWAAGRYGLAGREYAREPIEGRLASLWAAGRIHTARAQLARFTHGPKGRLP